jgi:hypothetical protein
MSIPACDHGPVKRSWQLIFVALFLLPALSPAARAQEHEDFDQYKLRFSAFYFNSSPSGTLQGESDNVPIDLGTLNFNSYSTYFGEVDWKFTRKNHFYVTVSPFYTSRSTVLNQTIVFQGQTFQVGTAIRSDLHAILIAPGYQYDIIRRKRGHLGIGAQFNVFDTTAKISAAAQTVNGVPQAPFFAQGSLLAPIPVLGAQYRLYLTNSPRLFVEGNIYGMYFFGYGNFLSASDNLGLTLVKHISINAGYQLASRFIVTNQTDRVGIHLTQHGPTAGLEFSF